MPESLSWQGYSQKGITMTDDRPKTIQKGSFLGLERAEWWLWVTWVASTVAGVVGGGVVFGPIVVYVLFTLHSLSELERTVSIAAGGVVFGVVGGVVAGTTQWIILRRRIHRSGRWVLASVVGWV